MIVLAIIKDNQNNIYSQNQEKIQIHLLQLKTTYTRFVGHNPAARYITKNNASPWAFPAVCPGEALYFFSLGTSNLWVA